jgi:hypothetical protein
MAAEPISKEYKKYLLTRFIDELNNLFPLDLATEFICDRYTDREVFDKNQMDHMALVLIGSSHLRNYGRFARQEDWKVYDLITPGW